MMGTRSAERQLSHGAITTPLALGMVREDLLAVLAGMRILDVGCPHH